MLATLERSLSTVHPSWMDFFDAQSELLNTIFSGLDERDIAPSIDNIFRAFTEPREGVRVVIFGQDPYPGLGIADGLAFSSTPQKPIPASLRNIFQEYESDIGVQAPKTPDLSNWAKNGVLLLNRTLTTSLGERNAHVKSDWVAFTSKVAESLGERDVIAILWGNYAKELSTHFSRTIESAHPSPLSARRGFFGSRPFSRVNEMLRERGEEEIDWHL